MLLKEKLAISPINSFRVLDQRFLLEMSGKKQKKVVKQIAPNLFPKELTSFATECTDV